MALIDKDEALSALNAQADEMFHWDKRWEEQRKGILTAVRIVSDIKPKQEIIHCKGCKHWNPQFKTANGNGLGSCDFHNVALVTSEGFCYWADRRGEAE